MFSTPHFRSKRRTCRTFLAEKQTESPNRIYFYPAALDSRDRLMADKPQDHALTFAHCSRCRPSGTIAAQRCIQITCSWVIRAWHRDNTRKPVCTASCETAPLYISHINPYMRSRSIIQIFTVDLSSQSSSRTGHLTPFTFTLSLAGRRPAIGTVTRSPVQRQAVSSDDVVVLIVVVCI